MAPEQGAQRLSKGRDSIAEVKERFELLRICDLGLWINLIADWGLTISDFVVVFKSAIENPHSAIQYLPYFAVFPDAVKIAVSSSASLSSKVTSPS